MKATKGHLVKSTKYLILSKLEEVKDDKDGWMALCPAHDDHNPSLHITETQQGDILLKCFAGCETEDIVHQMGLEMSDLFAKKLPPVNPVSGGPTTPTPPQPTGCTVNQYSESKNLSVEFLEELGIKDTDYNGSPAISIPYRDIDGNEIALRYRISTSRNGSSGSCFRWRSGDRPLPYGLWRIQDLESDHILLVEGESDCHTLWSQNVPAVGIPGSDTWKEEWAGYFGDLNKIYVVIEPDQGGQTLLEKLSQSTLQDRLHVIQLKEYKDPSDLYLTDPAGFEDALRDAISAAIPIADDVSESISLTVGPIAGEPLRGNRRHPEEMSEKGYVGLAGEIVRAIEPHTEADSVSLLMQFLVAFGNVIGRCAHFKAEADYHALNIFIVLVGKSSKGRKGTSWGHIKRMFQKAEPEWTEARILSGLSSGEGLIWNVRDPVIKEKAIRKDGQLTGETETVIDDPGVEDKRLLSVESEFASVLKTMSRESNILSPIIRQAWDSGDLRSLTKNAPGVATGAHISIIGHTTENELLRYLNETEMANGFANRFLYPCVKRSKLLPEGGNLTEQDLDPLVQRLKRCIDFATRCNELRRDEEARRHWIDIYERLSRERPGLAGSLAARAEAYVMRLACLYALLDMSSVICKKHLKAALAVWDYNEQSIRYIFGNHLGDSTADEILQALENQPEGMTRTQIRDLFQRNRKGLDVSRALALLLKNGLAYSRTDHSTGGRPTEMWFAQKYSTTNTTETI